ncbi:MAG TPA: hypothetical protein VHP37_18765 [Burkholderiales bacterium]|nr:hypothetical protein [Burkholderiales bacterium]
MSPALYKKLGYDPDTDFAPVGLVGSNPNLLAVHPSVPATSVAQLHRQLLWRSPIRSERAKWAKLVKDVGIEPQ